MTQVTNDAPGELSTTDALDGADAAPAAKCPFPHHLMAVAPACPVRHDGTPIVRTRADLFVRRMLFIRERPAGVTAASAYTAFQRSMMISAFRCTLTYVLFPFVLPMIGIATGVGPVLGIAIGTFAITCDTFTIRRFFTVDHKWRWYFSAVALLVIGLLFTLLVQDVAHLAT